MHNKSPEEKKAIIEKMIATRKKNKDIKNKERSDAISYVNGLKAEINKLELKLCNLKKIEAMNQVSCLLTNKTLLTYDEISSSALSYTNCSGIYFLLMDNEIVYVGQSINIYSRISQHKDKKFNRYAYVPCAVDMMDILESLYIHTLRPKLNSNFINGIPNAPIQLNNLLKMLPVTP